MTHLLQRMIENAPPGYFRASTLAARLGMSTTYILSKLNSSSSFLKKMSRGRIRVFRAIHKGTTLTYRNVSVNVNQTGKVWSVFHNGVVIAARQKRVTVIDWVKNEIDCGRIT